MSRKPATGGYVSSYCTKCKLDLGHTIMVMDGEKVMRVKCRTCGSEHIHRDKTKKSPAVRKTRVTGAAKKASPVKNPEKRWEDAIEKASGPEIPYSMETAFSAGNILVHDKFGRGVVHSTSPKKLSVIFRDKERLLISSN